MRRFTGLSLAALLAVQAIAADAQAPTASSPSLTLLGTAGGPPPHAGRSQPATLLRVGNANYLVDAGENVGQQLIRAGVAPSRVSAVFITHLHWDHTLGLDYLMATGWMMGRTTPLPIWGPPGIKELTDRQIAAVEVGAAVFRSQAPGRPALRSLYPVQAVDLDSPREIFRDANVRVTAVANSHFAQVHAAPHSYGPDKAYSYRFDTARGAVTFTGDTGNSAALTKLAAGSAILVAEICDFDSIRQALIRTQTPGAQIDNLLTHMKMQHLSAEDVGRLARQAGVKKLVLSHYVMGQDFNPDAFVPQIRKFFDGEIIVGKDLATIPLP